MSVAFCVPISSNMRKNKRKKVEKRSVSKEQKSFIVKIPSQPTNSAKSSSEPISSNSKKTGNKKNSSSVNRNVVSNINMKEFNVFHIDEIVRKKLEDRMEMLPFFEKDLRKTLSRINNSKTKDLNIKFNVTQQLINLRRQIQDSQSTLELGLYIFKTHLTLEKIRKLLSTDASRSFVTNKNFNVTTSHKKEELILQYVSVARLYVNIENYARKATILKCNACGSIDIRRSLEDDTCFLCVKCNAEIEILDDTPTFKDTDRINMANRYTYSRRAHFIEAMKKFQGKHNIDPEMLQIVVNILILEMNYHSLTPDNVNKDTLYMFLVEKKLNLYYDDINLLFHIITGEPCPEFGKDENILLECFEMQEKALEEITALDKNDTRINSINVYYKLYKLLQRLGYSYTKNDFYILKTKAKEDEHDEKMKKAWAKLGWEWKETF